VTRLLSVSEAGSLLDCSWRHALGYTGALTGGQALVQRDTPMLLREGKAWGRAMAALHGSWDRTTQLVDAEAAAVQSIREDAAERERWGLYDPVAEAAAIAVVLGALHHYHATTEPLPLHGAETHLVMPLPARERHSNRYKLEAYLDGLHTDQHGTWVVEFKWRSSRLLDYELAARQRQLRWYAWLWQEYTRRLITGVILDERLGQVPEPVRRNQDGRVSRVQSCTPEAYEAAGGRDADVLARLKAKQWQARRRITFRAHELEQAGWELRSLARLVHLYDSGQLAPIRHAHERNCRGCLYRAVCDDPWDADLVDSLYERVPAKRDRVAVPDAA
jgi:PD-(D/E)XK nuclease superfamily